MKRILPVVLFSFALFHAGAQQPLLMLQTKNSNKNAYYNIGEVISFRLKEDKTKFSGEIVALRDSIIVFPEFAVKVSEISSLYIDEKTKWWLRYKVEQIGLFAGAGYLILDLLNTGEIDSERW